LLAGNLIGLGRDAGSPIVPQHVTDVDLITYLDNFRRSASASIAACEARLLKEILEVDVGRSGTVGGAPFGRRHDEV
jgi:hypothetical protein